MPALTVDSTGFSPAKLQDVRSRMVELWRAAFGDNADTSSTSPDGLEIDTHSLLIALVWQGLGQLASSAYGRYARGVFLDLALDQYGKRRIEARASTASLVFYGTDASPVNSGAIVATEQGGQFLTDAAATIGGDDSVWVVRIDTIANATLYRVVVDGVNHDYTSDASATLAEVRAGIAAAVDASGSLVGSEAGVDANGLGLIVIESSPGAVVSVTGPMTRYHAMRVAATAPATGPVIGLTGTIRTLVSAIAGVVGVTSTGDAVVGNDIESDGAFFSRHIRTLSANAARSPEAVAHRIMKAATDAGGINIDASVVENESIDPDAEGRPSKSFETYVDADILTDDQIAELIWQSKTHGAEAYGATVVNVLDTKGRSHPIGFTRTTKLYLHLEITITDGEGYPTVGTPLETAAAAVATYFGDAGPGRPSMAQDFYRIQVNGPLLSAVPGIAGVSVRTDVTAAPGDPPTFASSDVVVAEGERVVLDSSRITMIQL